MIAKQKNGKIKTVSESMICHPNLTLY